MTNQTTKSFGLAVQNTDGVVALESRHASIAQAQTALGRWTEQNRTAAKIVNLITQEDICGLTYGNEVKTH